MGTIILLWLLVNTWVTLVFLAFHNDSVENKRDLADLLLLAVVSPWPFLIIRFFVLGIRKIKKRA